jgi:hypothetical protein
MKFEWVRQRYGSAITPPDEFASVLTIGTKFATFHDPAVQQFLATDPTVKGSVLPFQTS